MTWQLAVLLKVVAGSLLAPFVFYLLGRVGPRERISRIALLYTWALVFALVIAGIPTEFSPAFWPIMLVGAVVVGGVYFQLRAIAWSPSLSAIFVSLVSLIPLFLSAFGLGEWRTLANITLVFGVVLAVSGVALWVHEDVREKRQKESVDSVPRSFWLHGAAFAAIFGIATFLQNVWAKSGVSDETFLVPWYLGTFCGAWVLFLVSRTLPREEKKMRTSTEMLLTGLAGFTIVVSMWFAYVSFTMVEQARVMPIYAVGDVLGYAAVGIIVGIITGQWATVRGLKGLALGMGIAGALIIALAR